jgi:hypothetical protein
MNPKSPLKINVGYDAVELHVTGEAGGHFTVESGLGEATKIYVGLDQEHWEGVLGTLIHEVAEYALIKKRCRWEPSCDLAEDQAQYLFVMNHSEFSDLVSRVTISITQAAVPLRVAWEKFQKKGQV